MSTIRISSDIAKQAALRQISSLTIDGTMECVIRRYKKSRTNSQNRLYWLWLSFIAGETGNDSDVLHEFFRRKYLQSKIVQVFGEQSSVRQSTAALKSEEFTDYLKRIESFAASEIGITLPHPDDVYHEAMGSRYGA